MPNTYKKVFAAARSRLQTAPTEARNFLALFVIERMVPRTPVDTGQARGNYRMDLGDAQQITDASSLDPAGSRTPRRIRSEILAAAPRGKMVLSNWLPYISRLEHGYSLQAPNGFLALTAAEAHAFAPFFLRKALGGK